MNILRSFHAYRFTCEQQFFEKLTLTKLHGWYEIVIVCLKTKHKIQLNGIRKDILNNKV